ncbi:catechol 2,3-dioxygenase-like lactoylglutathione lyase family enzyme [Chitinophaga polysaccharea]|uniref:Catechol 2,3-dioxygenase-like lactoylglutathione lyase family enzyme n=1 Tax=Chitinophaga polysaccharea TaxID=1293035 RepID=A0A561PCB1_9BACT|nr:VOC family protein [Chitinophaga polysaccharea]TWF35762.1 catechol 2,3-dioxygenase-like lactoylglutathione lyase family enzyme [Chitinophaga polysaccharea]
MIITHLDHLVITVKNLSVTCDFYAKILGMEIITFGNDRKALRFGQQKINLHEKGREIAPMANFPTMGSADLCFISATPVENVLQELQDNNIPVLEGGIVERTGATGKIRSVYFRDPDGNLLEVSNYIL